MKILYVNGFGERHGHGGAEETLWTLMCGMRDAGHQCVLLATSAERGLARSEQEGITVWKAGIRNLYWPNPRNRRQPAIRALWHLQDSYNPWMQGYVRRVVRAERPDIVSLHNLPGWSAATWRTLSRLGIPAVQVLHDYYAICPRTTMYTNGRNCTDQCRSCEALRLPHHALSRRLTAVVGVSQYILDAHRRLGYFAGAPIQRVIHNVRAPETLGCDNIGGIPPHSGVRFGFIGTLTASKGVSELIDAFLQAAIPNSELWIAGSGHPEYEHGLHVQANGDSRIRFLGRVTPAEFYPWVDVVVIPSRWNEPLGMVVPEAFAFGKPVIGSQRGGIPEMIRAGDNGLLFEPEHPQELSTAMRCLATDAALRQRMASAARESARPFLNLGRFTTAYEDVYRAAILEANRLQGAVPVEGGSREMKDSAPLTGVGCVNPGEAQRK